MGAFKNETVKLFKTKYAYIFTAIIIVQTAIAVYIQKVQPDGWHTVITTQNAPSLPLAFINTTAQFMSVFIAIYAAWIVADEYKKGTLKLSLFGSVSRTGLLHSKIFALLLFNVFIIVLNVIAAYAIGIAAFGWSGFATYKGIIFNNSLSSPMGDNCKFCTCLFEQRNACAKIRILVMQDNIFYLLYWDYAF